MDIDVKQKKGGTLNGVYEQMSEIIGFDNVVKLYESGKAVWELQGKSDQLSHKAFFQGVCFTGSS